MNAAMGYLKGIEEHDSGAWGYGRQIPRADLRKPMLELCPLLINEYGIVPVAERTAIARVWMGWPAFDVRICKFEFDQWLAACDVTVNADYAASHVEETVKVILTERNKEMEGSTKCEE